MQDRRVVGAGRALQRLLPRLSWERADRHRSATVWALTGLAVGGLLALFGLPPIDLHGPLHWFGIMDPLCGGTRALRLTMAGQWRAAWSYNPLSPLLVIGAGLALARHLVGALTGWWLSVRLAPRWTLYYFVGGLLVAALEVNQQLHAELLRGP